MTLENRVRLESLMHAMLDLTHTLSVESYLDEEIEHSINVLEHSLESDDPDVNDPFYMDSVMATYSHATGESYSYASLEEITTNFHICLKSMRSAVGELYTTIVERVPEDIKASEDLTEKLSEAYRGLYKELKSDDITVRKVKGDKELEFNPSKILQIHGKFDLDVLDEGIKLVLYNLLEANEDHIDNTLSYYDALIEFFGSKPDSRDEIKDDVDDHAKAMRTAYEKLDGVHIPGNKTFKLDVAETMGIEFARPSVLKSDDVDNLKETKITLTEDKRTSLLDEIAQSLDRLDLRQKKIVQLIEKRRKLAEVSKSFTEKVEAGEIEGDWAANKLRWSLRKVIKNYVGAIVVNQFHVFNYTKALLDMLKKLT